MDIGPQAFSIIEFRTISSLDNQIKPPFQQRVPLCSPPNQEQRPYSLVMLNRQVMQPPSKEPRSAIRIYQLNSLMSLMGSFKS